MTRPGSASASRRHELLQRKRGQAGSRRAFIATTVKPKRSATQRVGKRGSSWGAKRGADSKPDE